MIDKYEANSRMVENHGSEPRARWQALLYAPIWSGGVPPDPDQLATRIRHMERNIGLPTKAVVIGVLVYYLFFSRWFDEVTLPRQFALELVQRFFLVYVAFNVGVACLLIGMDQIPLRLVQWGVFILALVDAVFLAMLIPVTEGFESVLFWVFPGLILRNAISVAVPPLQIILNGLVCFCCVLAGILDYAINKLEFELLDARTLDMLHADPPQLDLEPLVLRFLLLLLVAICAYGLQVLLEKQRRADEEAREFALRREQLRVTGRLAAEIAHQLKNPLGIINNAAFNLQRNVKEGKATITQQIRIIREEVERSDRIITDLMGYAKLAEGKIEKLNVTEELERAIEAVFPTVVHYETEIQRDYGPALPPLLLQRNHLAEILVNVLQNAREVLDGRGRLLVSAHYGETGSVVVVIEDNGPGIAQDLREKVFEPYFTTKPKGTGLGLAIVKHNTEIYGGTVQVESELGKGTRFVLQFPVKSFMRLRT